MTGFSPLQRPCCPAQLRAGWVQFPAQVCTCCILASQSTQKSTCSCLLPCCGTSSNKPSTLTGFSWPEFKHTKWSIPHVFRLFLLFNQHLSLLPCLISPFLIYCVKQSHVFPFSNVQCTLPLITAPPNILRKILCNFFNDCNHSLAWEWSFSCDPTCGLFPILRV